MRCLNHIDFLKEKHGNSRIFIYKELGQEIRDTLKEIALNNLKRKPFKRSIELIHKQQISFVSKTTPIRCKDQRLRATFNIKRRGSYERAIAGIHNQIKLSGYTYIPIVYGYGYKINSMGITSSTTLITEYISKSFNIIEFIESHPNLISPVLMMAVNAMAQHLQHNYIHLDLWGANLLVAKDLSSYWFIDFEYCMFNSKRSVEEKFGYCLGYFYRHTLSKYISFFKYKKILNEWFSDRNQDINKNKTLFFCTYASENEISRKERLAYFKPPLLNKKIR